MYWMEAWHALGESTACIGWKHGMYWMEAWHVLDGGMACIGWKQAAQKVKTS